MLHRIICGSVCVLMFVCVAASGMAQETKIPDFSNLPRSEVPAAYTWRIEDLYPDMDAWKRDRDVVQGLIAQIDTRAKDWTSTPQKFLSLYQFTDSIGLIMRKLYAYAGNQSNMDLGNATYRSMQGEMQSIGATFGAKVAFRNDDILKMDEKSLRGYFEKEPKLAQYRFRVEEVLRARKYVLPKDQQKIFSLTGLFSGATAQVADVLNNVEIPAQDVTLSDGSRVTLECGRVHALSRNEEQCRPLTRDAVILVGTKEIREFSRRPPRWWYQGRFVCRPRPGIQQLSACAAVR